MITAGPSGAAPALAGWAAADLERAIRERGLDPALIVVPDRVTAEMVQWVHEAVPARLPPTERVDRLMAAVLSPSGLDLAYEGGATTTAAEAFRDRRANCLGFSFLIVGLAVPRLLAVW
jgi:hypothetical protein